MGRVDRKTAQESELMVYIVILIKNDINNR